MSSTKRWATLLNISSLSEAIQGQSRGRELSKPQKKYAIPFSKVFYDGLFAHLKFISSLQNGCVQAYFILEFTWQTPWQPRHAERTIRVFMGIVFLLLGVIMVSQL